MFCQHCGAAIADDFSFCAHCGRRRAPQRSALVPLIVVGVILLLLAGAGTALALSGGGGSSTAPGHSAAITTATRPKRSANSVRHASRTTTTTVLSVPVSQAMLPPTVPLTVPPTVPASLPATTTPPCPSGGPVGVITSSRTTQDSSAFPAIPGLFHTTTAGTVTNHGSFPVIVANVEVTFEGVDEAPGVPYVASASFSGSDAAPYVLPPGASLAWTQTLDAVTMARPTGGSVSVKPWAWASRSFVNCPAGL